MTEYIEKVISVVFSLFRKMIKNYGYFIALHINNWSGGSILIYANNEPKSVLARDLGDCCDNYEKLAKRVSCSLREQRATVRLCLRW